MPLSWNEIRQRSITFAREWCEARRERGEAQTFWNEFFNVFGIPRRTVASFEVAVRGLGGGHNFIDVLWRGKLIGEHKSRGGDLSRAHSQAIGYIQALHNGGQEAGVWQFSNGKLKIRCRGDNSLYVTENWLTTNVVNKLRLLDPVAV